MIPNDLAKTSTAAMKLVILNLILPKKDIFLQNFSTEAISIIQAGTEIREVTTINRDMSLKFLLLIFIK